LIIIKGHLKVKCDHR